MSNLAFLHTASLVHAFSPANEQINPPTAQDFQRAGRLPACVPEPAEMGWITLRQDPNGNGCNAHGRWQADFEVATNAPLSLIAQILPARLGTRHVDSNASYATPDRRLGYANTSELAGLDVAGGSGLCAVLDESVWIDVLLRQFPATHPTLVGLSMLELAVYGAIDKGAHREVKLLKTVKASPMPMEMMSAFTLGYRQKQGKIMVEINSETDQQAVTRVEFGPFGECLPWVKLRSGKQSPTSGVFRAKFQQKVSWSTR
jgi:hypothetical protein